jgi:SAM-dependent methyltransferase
VTRIDAAIPRPPIPADDPDAAIAALKIGPNDRVLEVGGAANAFRRANVVCDLTFGGTRQRNGSPGVFRKGVRYVEASVEALPFDDGAFDFVWCTQVLEHVRDPAKAASELARVARRGFVEVPSRVGEALNGNPTHRWVVDVDGTTLVFHPRTFVEHPFDHRFYGAIFRDPDMRRRSEGALRGELNHQIVFDGALPVRVEPVPPGAVAFNYENPAEAARAHYHFARCCLRDGVDPVYSYVDAQTAAALLPRSIAARLLLAVYEARLRRFDEALRRLSDVDDVASATLRRTIEAARRGDVSAFESLPLPGPLLEVDAATPASGRPVVSVAIPVDDVAGLRDAVEGALALDYENAEVVVAASRPKEAHEALDGLLDVARLRVVDAPGLRRGALYNAAFLNCGGEIFACALPGDRFFASHADRLLSAMAAEAAEGAFSDALRVRDGATIAGGVESGRGGSTPFFVSGLFATRAACVRTGPFDVDAEDFEARWLRGLAARAKLARVQAATYATTRPTPDGASLLERARAAAGLDPTELLRELVSVYARLDAATRREAAREGPTT